MSIVISQVGKPYYVPVEDSWIYSWQIRAGEIDWTFRTLVPDAVPIASRDSQAKSQFQSFVSGLSSEVSGL